MKKVMFFGALFMVVLGLFSACAVVVHAAHGATFGRPQAYLTPDQAENTVYDSTWAEDHDVYDLSCTGVGRGRALSTGELTFKNFNCDFIELTDDYGGTITCKWNADVYFTTLIAFRVADINHYKCGVNG